MATCSDYAIVYDISINKERTLIYNLLSDYGTNVQRSVFECRLTKRSLGQLVQKLKALEIKSGNLKIYRVYNSTTITLGIKGLYPDDNRAAFII